MEQKLIKIIYDKFGEEYGYDLPEDKLIFERISDASRKAIIELNNMNRTEVNIPFIHSDSTGPLHILFSVGIEDSFGRSPLSIMEIMSDFIQFCLIAKSM